MTAVPVVTIMIPMVVAPSPIFLLLLRTKFAEVATSVAMRLVGPALVVDDFVIVPHVIIRVIRIVHTVRVMLAGDSRQRRCQHASQQQSPERVRTQVHDSSPLQSETRTRRISC